MIPPIRMRKTIFMSQFGVVNGIRPEGDVTSDLNGKGVPEDVLNVLPGVVLFQIPSSGSGSSNATRNCNFNRQRVWNS